MKNPIKLLLLLISLNTFAQSQNIIIIPKVDKRVELLSIVFRLAGAEEYSSNEFPEYVDQIQKHFGGFKNHDLIEYIKLIREKNGIGYDAIMYLAISITEPPNMKPIIPFSRTIPEERWGEKTALDFLNLLNQFYHDTNTEKFFNEHADMYQMAAQKFEYVYEGLNQQWYQNFYGQNPKGEYRMITALGIGGFNYGPRTILPNEKEVIYAIIGVTEFDDLGVPKFDKDIYFPTVLHEFNHSFINHLIEKFKPELQKSGEAIYKNLGSKMRKQRYTNWQTMFSEALVRASVIKYMKDNNYAQELIDAELTKQLERGFLWTENLIKELERYDSKRDKYPSLEVYMPEIVKFFNHIAPIIEEKTPKVISIEPLDNNAINVDHTIKKITINFDQELKGTGHSFNQGDKGEKAFPKIENVIYSANNKSVTFDVNLEPDKEYQFVLTGLAFKTKDGYELADYEVTFNTKK